MTGTELGQPKDLPRGASGSGSTNPQMPFPFCSLQQQQIFKNFHILTKAFCVPNMPAYLLPSRGNWLGSCACSRTNPSSWCVILGWKQQRGPRGTHMRGMGKFFTVQSKGGKKGGKKIPSCPHPAAGLKGQTGQGGAACGMLPHALLYRRRAPCSARYFPAQVFWPAQDKRERPCSETALRNSRCRNKMKTHSKEAQGRMG